MRFIEGSSATVHRFEGAQMRRVILFLFVIVVATSNRAAAQTPYYQGKTITIITGSQAGDLFDIYARMIATHMGKNIPGNPSILAQNMPGAGHMSRRISFTALPNLTV